MITLDKDDRIWMVTAIVLPIVTWWCLKGNKKYNIKGMMK